MFGDPFRLPCLQCRTLSVKSTTYAFLHGPQIDDELMCEHCGRRHILRFVDGKLFYDVYSWRYTSDFYDPGEKPFIVLGGCRGDGGEESPGGAGLGPQMFFKRKRHFSKTQIHQIWIASRRQCVHCGRKWKLSEQGRYGWHIDHDIPNANGGCPGSGTEAMANFQVSCAKCNLKKGRGISDTQIRRAVANVGLLIQRGLAKQKAAEEALLKSTTDETNNSTTFHRGSFSRTPVKRFFSE